MKQTPITVTQPDYERLTKLLDQSDTGNRPYIGALLEELERANVVEAAEVESNVVTMNSTVHFINEATKHEYKLKLVYPDQAGQDGTLSVLAPMGCALLGLSVDQSIELDMPNGRQLSLLVKEVIDQPEARLWHAEKDKAGQ